MAKRRKKLLAAVVISVAGLLALAGVTWWCAGRVPVFRFLGGQQPVYQGRYRDGGSIVVYSWPVEFESVAAQAREGLLRAGFVEISPQGTRDRWREFSRPGPRRIGISVERGKFVEGSGGGVRVDPDMPGWVWVGVRRSRFDPFTYLGYLWKRVTPPPPPPPQAKSTTAQ